jgi:adenosylcobinamide-phosphate synthase
VHLNLQELATLGGALLIDRIIGEWPSAVHPVVWMGKVTIFLERLAPAKGRRRQLAWGAVIAFLVPAIFAGASAILLASVARYPWVELLLAIWLLKSTFALRALADAARQVEGALGRDALSEARHGLRSLCSRDSSALAPSELVAATIESVAENASDSFVAPLLYYAVLGVPGALFYRAVNTLDAMIGYHGKYEYLGKVPARLDDLLNWLPARVTAFLLLFAGWLGGKRVRRGWSTWRRDAHTTESPNAGRPMAVMAGLLGVELEKMGHYRLGDPLEPLSVKKIGEACRMLGMAALLGTSMVFVLIGVRHVVE